MTPTQLRTELMKMGLSDIKGPHDVFHDGDKLAETYVKGEHVPCLARIEFNASPGDRTVVLNIYDNDTFHVGTCATGTTRERVHAYARAHQLITLFDLKDTSP